MGSDTGVSTATSRATDIERSVCLGARAPSGSQARFITALAITWSLFQLWFASPLPYILNIGVFSDTQARSIHLAFAIFIAFAAYPGWRNTDERVPVIDWIFGTIAAFCAAYLYLFHSQLAARAGQPELTDLIIGFTGLILILEATRRAMGPFIVLVAAVFIAYSLSGQLMPAVLQHGGASVTRVLEHQWLATEGVFGVPLGVSASFVFLYVLFGTLLTKAGAGNYMMQLSLAFLGHLRGGPAKVAVVSSGLNGLVSGSAIANVVSSGIFTIPLMKRTGISGVKAGAIETAASINGQIMPPVMGAAAFIMVEYVGLPYSEIVKHAFLPAVISYISLFYIVHIEALKVGSSPLQKERKRPWQSRLIRHAFGWSGTIAALCAIYYVVIGLRFLLGAAALPVLIAVGLAAYIAILKFSARYPDLQATDSSRALTGLPEGWEVARTGLHLLIPVVVLVWCLIVERLSPALSAFWATVSVATILLSKDVLLALFRGERGFFPSFRKGAGELVDGLALGGRNMVGVALACATAGIVVGTVTLTGLGLMMTEFIEVVSGGNIYLVLALTALATLVIGCGVPTTANYILVATLMAPVIVELGAEAGVAIPLIAVHLFVFYFGIMADSTPPVGLGAYAASAISKEHPLKTCVQAGIYSLRTGILAFLFILNPQLLLIDITNVFQGAVVISAAIVGCMIFAAATLNYWLVKSRVWESVVLLLVSVTLIYPSGWLDLVFDKYKEVPPTQLERIIENTPPGGRVTVVFDGMTIEGERTSRTVSLRLGKEGDAPERLRASGLYLATGGDDLRVSQVQFGSYAARLRIEPGFRLTTILMPADRPSSLFVYLLAIIALAIVATIQMRRKALVASRHGASMRTPAGELQAAE